MCSSVKSVSLFFAFKTSDHLAETI